MKHINLGCQENVRQQSVNIWIDPCRGFWHDKNNLCLKIKFVQFMLFDALNSTLYHAWQVCKGGCLPIFFAGLITIPPLYTSRVCRIMYSNPARPLYIIISIKVNVNLFEKTQCTRNAYFYIVDTCKESYKSIHTLIPQSRQETNLLQISEIINHLNYIRQYTCISIIYGES